MSIDPAANQKHRQWLGKAAIVLVPILAVVGALLLGKSGCAIWTVLTSVAVLVIGMFVTGATSTSISRPSGMRCTQCRATYAYGSAFFNDLDANPRDLSVSDIPKPQGRSPFLRGKSV